MALQNLFGDLALDTTAQNTNDIMAQLLEVTKLLTLLANNQAGITPMYNSSGAQMVSLQITSSNPTTSPLFGVNLGTYDTAGVRTYTDMPAWFSNSIMAEAQTLTQHIQVS